MKYDLHISVRIDTPRGGGIGGFQLSHDTQVELTDLGQGAALLAKIHELILAAGPKVSK